MASIDDSPPERSGIPWGTIASTLVLLFLFVGLLAIMMNAMHHIEPGEDSQAGEKQLQEVISLQQGRADLRRIRPAGQDLSCARDPRHGSDRPGRRCGQAAVSACRP